MRRLQHMGTLQRPSTAMGVTLQSRSTKRKVRNMRKLLITTTALLALTGAAQAGWIAEMEQRAKTEQAQARARDVTAEIGIAGFTQCHHTAFWYTSIPAEATCWSESSNKSVKVYLMQGRPDALDDGENLRVRATVRPAVTYRYTPEGQLPACDSAQVVNIIATIHNRPRSAIFDPREIGTTQTGKKLCTVAVASPHWSNYTVEWLNDGRYWVQF